MKQSPVPARSAAEVIPVGRFCATTSRSLQRIYDWQNSGSKHRRYRKLTGIWQNLRKGEHLRFRL